jgi:endonuclease/exonuclease/phosphatase family metal-dependent hydrolase
MHAAVDMNGTRIAVVNVSLSGPKVRRTFTVIKGVPNIQDYMTDQRAQETAALLRVIDRSQGALIVLGDFNTSDREQGYDQLAARLHDVYRETAWGFGFTYPTSKKAGPLSITFPLIRIDYVWAAGGIVPAASQVHCGSESDHCAVTADLQVGAQLSASQGAFL